MADRHVAVWIDDEIRNSEGKVKKLIKSWASLCTRNGENLLLKTENLFRETARLILSVDWFRVTPCTKSQLTLSLHNCIQTVARSCSRSVRLIQSLSELAVSPWDNPALTSILRNERNNPQELAIQEYYCKSVNPRHMWLRLQVLEETNNEDLALRLCNCCLRCNAVKDERKLKDLQLRLLLRLGFIQEVVQKLQQFSVKDGLELIKRNRRASEFCQHITEIFLVRDVTTSVTHVHTQKLMELWVDLKSETDFNKRNIWQETLKLSTLFTTSAHFYLMVDILYKKFGKRLLRLYVELYIKALTVDLNFLENARTSSTCEQISEIENHFADVLFKLASLLAEQKFLARECLLSAFSVDPSEKRLSQLSTFSDTDKIEVTVDSSRKLPTMFLEPCSGACHCYEEGACRRGKTTVDSGGGEVKPSSLEIDKMEDGSVGEVESVVGEIVESVTRQSGEVTREEMISSFTQSWDSHIIRSDDAIYTVSSFILDTVHDDLPLEILQDLTIVLDEPRNKTLSWDLGWEELKKRCEIYLDTKLALKVVVESAELSTSNRWETVEESKEKSMVESGKKEENQVEVKEDKQTKINKLKEVRVNNLQVSPPKVDSTFLFDNECQSSFLKDALLNKNMIKLVKVPSVKVENPPVIPPVKEKEKEKSKMSCEKVQKSTPEKLKMSPEKGSVSPEKIKSPSDLSVSAKTQDVIFKAGLTMKQLNPTVVISHSDIVGAEKMLTDDKVDKKEDVKDEKTETPRVTLNQNSEVNSPKKTVECVGKNVNIPVTVGQVSNLKKQNSPSSLDTNQKQILTQIVFNPSSGSQYIFTTNSPLSTNMVSLCNPGVSDVNVPAQVTSTKPPGVKTITLPKRINENVLTSNVEKVNVQRQVLLPFTIPTSTLDYRACLPKNKDGGNTVLSPKSVAKVSVAKVQDPVALPEDLVRNLCAGSTKGVNKESDGKVRSNEEVDKSMVAELLGEADDKESVSKETVTLYSASGSASTNFEPSVDTFEKEYEMFLLSNNSSKASNVDVAKESKCNVSTSPKPTIAVVGKTLSTQFQHGQNTICIPTTSTPITTLNATTLTPQQLKLLTINSVQLPPQLSSTNFKSIAESEASSTDKKNRILLTKNDKPKWVGVRYQHGGMEYRKAKSDSDKNVLINKSTKERQTFRKRDSPFPITWQPQSNNNEKVASTNCLNNNNNKVDSVRQQLQHQCKQQSAVSEIIQRIDYAPPPIPKSSNEPLSTVTNTSTVVSSNRESDVESESGGNKKRNSNSDANSTSKKQKTSNLIRCEECSKYLSSFHSLKRHLKAVHKKDDSHLSTLSVSTCKPKEEAKEEVVGMDDSCVFVPRRCSLPPKENSFVADSSSVVDFESNFDLFTDPDVGENSYVVGDTSICNRNIINSNNNNNRTILERFSYIAKDNEDSSTLRRDEEEEEDDENGDDSLGSEGSKQNSRSRSHSRNGKRCTCCETSPKKTKMDTTRALRQVRMSSLKAKGIQEFRRRNCHRR